MKSVCIVCDGYWDQLKGGAELQLWILGEALAGKGYVVHYVFVDRGTPTNPTPIILEPIQVSKIFRRVFFPCYALLGSKLSEAIAKINPDVIINRVANGLTGVCARYSYRHKVPMIWHIANVTDLLPWRPSFNHTFLLSYIDRRVMEYGIRRATCIIAQAEYQAEMLKIRYGRRVDAVIPNFHPQQSGPIHKSPNLTVAWVANLKQKKQPEQFIRLARAFSDNPCLRFVMVGRPASGTFQQSLNELIRETPNLTYWGEVSNEKVNELLCAASVFVNTSLFEGFPNTFIQAWLRRVPVVSLSFDPDNVLKKKKLGFHSESFKQLCVDVRRLVDDHALREEIGERAQAYAIVTHGLETNVTRIAKLIDAC